MMKAGVVGLGYMGKNHARVLWELGSSVLGYDSFENAYNGLRIEKCESLKSLLKQVDVVSICTPTTEHKSAALQAIEMGIPTMIEKPVAESVASAKEIESAAKKHNVPVATGFLERYNPSVLQLLQLRKDDEVIHSMDFKRVNPYSQRIRDCGVVIDMGVHDIDLCCYISGKKPKEVFAHAKNKGGASDQFENTAIITMIYDDLVATVHTDWLTPMRVRTAEVLTSGSYYKLDLLDGGKVEEYDRYVPQPGVDLRPTSVKFYTPRRVEPLREELKDFKKFVDASVFGANAMASNSLAMLKDGIDALQIAEAALQSSKKREVVRLNWE